MTITLSRDYAHFVSNLSAFVWAMKIHRGFTWEKMAKHCNVSIQTIHNLAEGKTKNPQMFTCWKILKFLDNLSVIQHSKLEQYRNDKVVKLRRVA